jgi:hypothetical protein
VKHRLGDATYKFVFLAAFHNSRGLDSKFYCSVLVIDAACSETCCAL